MISKKTLLICSISLALFHNHMSGQQEKTDAVRMLPYAIRQLFVEVDSTLGLS